MTTKHYDLEAFTADMDRAVAAHDVDAPSAIDQAKGCLARLIEDMSWLDPRHAADKGGMTQYLLHRHPEGRYTVVSVVFGPGYATPVHDHSTWGVVGVWRGEEREERFKRTDDGTREGYAQLRSAGVVVNTPGAITRLIPPDEEIHRITNVTSVPVCSIHVYGADLSGRVRKSFNLDTGAVTEFVVNPESVSS